MSNPVKTPGQTSFTVGAVVAAAVLVAHAAIGAISASSLQAKADLAAMPVYSAERIVVTAKAPMIVKADRIEVRAVRTAAQIQSSSLAVLAWNKVA